MAKGCRGRTGDGREGREKGDFGDTSYEERE